MTMLSRAGTARRPRNSPNTGTHHIHGGQEAALAVEGLSVMPICWAAEAANSRVPQQSPAVSSSLRSRGALDNHRLRRACGGEHRRHGRWAAAPAHASPAAPGQKRIGPMPEPALWATRTPCPDKEAQSISMKCFVCVFISADALHFHQTVEVVTAGIMKW